MRKFIIFFFTFFFSTVTQAQQSETYLCAPDKMLGFQYNESSREWDAVLFENDHNYLIQRASSLEGFYRGAAWVVKDLYGDTSLMGCYEDFNEYGFLFCSSMKGDLKFNRKNSRYLYIHTLGYYNDNLPDQPQDGSDTPYIEMGTCSLY